MKYLGMVNLSFALRLTTCDFLRGRLRGQSVLAVGHHSSMHTCARMMYQLQLHAWVALCYKIVKRLLSKKNRNKSPWKDFSSPCRDVQCICMMQHWLTKYTNKKCHAQWYAQWYAPHNVATLFNNHPYISSSGMSVGTKFTATYVGMVVE